jgi:heme-degrading monooxygenase HmoA
MTEAPQPPPIASPSSAPKFVAVSTFVVANGMEEQIKEAFINRPHLVDEVPGFVRMDVISPLNDPREIWLITYWQDERSFHDWHRSHMHHDSHKYIPKGLKLIPKSAKLRFFNFVAA